MSDYQKPVPNLMKALRESLEKAVQHPATPQEPDPSIDCPLCGEWQPIETAPKDGRRVLVMWEYWSSEPFVAYFKHGRWNGEVALSECSDDGPTHWMPLPSPPTPEGNTP